MARIVLPEVNNEAEGYEQPLDPAQDALAARGFYPQTASTPDELVGIERTAGGELLLRDTQCGDRLLSSLLGGSGSGTGQGAGGGVGGLSAKNVELTVNATTSSQSWVTLLSTTLAVLLDSGILFFFSGQMTGQANKTTSFQVLIDGVQVAVSTLNTGSGGSNVSMFLSGLKPLLAAGSHTVVVQWKTDGSTSQINPISNPGYEGARITLIEIAKP